MTAVCAALAPRLFDRFADDALRGEVAAATPFQRNIQLVEERSIQPGRRARPDGRGRRGGRALETPDAGRRPAAVPRPSYLAETIRWAVLEDTHDPGFVRLRVQQDVADHIQFVEGRPPTDATREISATIPAPRPARARTSRWRSRSSRSRFRSRRSSGSGCRRRHVAAAAGRDRPARRAGAASRSAARSRSSGSFEATDPDEEYWLDDTALIRPSIRRSGDTRPRLT